jgi:hypothetical protein
MMHGAYNVKLQADFRCSQLRVLDIQYNDYLDIREHFFKNDVFDVGSNATLGKYYVSVCMAVALIVAAATLVCRFAAVD